MGEKHQVVDSRGTRKHNQRKHRNRYIIINTELGKYFQILKTKDSEKIIEATEDRGSGEKIQLYQRRSNEINTLLLNKDNCSQRTQDYVLNMLKDKLDQPTAHSKAET